MAREEAVLGWTLRLPGIDDALIAAVSGIPVPDAARARAALSAAGWTASFAADDPEAGDVALGAASAAALRALRADPAAAEDALGPLPRRLLLPRHAAAALAGPPAARSVHAALGAIAEAIARARAGGIEWAGPPAGPGSSDPADGGRPRLPWGHAEARWRAGGEEARFAIHADRPGVPLGVRRSLLARWRRAAAAAHPIAAESPLLVICPGRRALGTWIHFARETLRERGPSGFPPAAFALAGDACGGGWSVDDPIWHQPLRGGRLSLIETMRWNPAPGPPPAAAASLPGHRAPPRIGSAAEARRSLSSPPRGASGLRRAAALSVACGRGGARALILLAAQPWMSAADLARYEHVPLAAAERRLAVLRELGGAASARGGDGDERWILGPAGLHAIAARSGFAHAPRFFAGRVRARWADPSAPEPVPQAHAAGIARCMGLLARAARGAGGRLAEWWDEHWWAREIADEAPIPDAAMLLHGVAPGGAPAGAVLEYERVTRSARSAAKPGAWARWLQAGRWRGVFAKPPAVLIVYEADAPRAGSLLAAVRATDPALPIRAIGEAGLEAHGFAGPHWLRAGGGAGGAF